MTNAMLKNRLNYDNFTLRIKSENAAKQKTVWNRTGRRWWE